jgi:hypothetical protein
LLGATSNDFDPTGDRPLCRSPFVLRLPQRV